MAIRTHFPLNLMCYTAVGLTLFIFFLSSSAHAQESLRFDPTLRSGDPRRPLLEEDDPTASSPEILPPVTSESKENESDAAELGPRIKIKVTRIRISGNRTFSNEELAEVTKPYLNRQLDYEDLEEIRRKLTLYYVDRGYINSGAVLPDQKVEKGVVTYKVVEGELSEVLLSGNRWLRDWFYVSRIKRSAGPPLALAPLEQRLQRLQQHDLVRQLHAELKPGLEPGRSILSLNVEEALPFQIWLAVNNYQSPSVGSERGLLTLEHRSLAGIGDHLRLTYGRSQGLEPLWDIVYGVPFTPWDTALELEYRRNDFSVIEAPFQDLDVESESDIYSVSLRQPLWQTTNQEVALGLMGERLHSRAKLLGQSFSFSPGSIDGESTVSALRFSQEYVYRSFRHVIAGSSRFSWGIDTLDATKSTTDAPDGLFFAWLGQLQYAGILTPLAIQPILRTDIQLANDPLLSLEQISIGGRYSVRGYRENQIVRDNGVIASLETRIPLVKNVVWADYLQLAPFFDWGRGWNMESDASDWDGIYSAGIGLRWALSVPKTPFPLKTELEIYWGHPLETPAAAGEYDLQDDGVHFQFTLSAF